MNQLYVNRTFMAGKCRGIQTTITGISTIQLMTNSVVDTMPVGMLYNSAIHTVLTTYNSHVRPGDSGPRGWVEWQRTSEHRADSRTMEYSMKKVINETSRTITWTFDGGLEPVVFDPAKASAENRAYSELHGFAARIGDNAAITKSEKNGFIVTEAMRRAAILEMAKHYASGSTQWNMKASAHQPVQNATIAAIAAKLGVTYEEAQAKVAAQFLAELTGE